MAATRGPRRSYVGVMPPPRLRLRRHFSGLSFGPLEVRPWLRSARRPDERLIGWASAEEASGVSTLVRVAMGLLPGIGGAIAAAIFSARVRLIVLSDQRVWILANTPGGPRASGKGVRHEIGLGAVAVTTPDVDHEDEVFTFTLHDSTIHPAMPMGKPVSFTIKNRRERPTQRLIDGMQTLAGAKVVRIETSGD